MVQRLPLTALFVFLAVLSFSIPAQAFDTIDAQLAEATWRFRRAEFNDGSATARERDYNRAENLAEKALDSSSGKAQAHFLIFAIRGRRLLEGGISLTEAWQFPQLGRHLDRTLALDPNHAHALAAKGGLLLQLPRALGGNPPEALPYLEQALALNPDGIGTRITYAKALREAGRERESVVQLERAAHLAIRQRDPRRFREAEKMLGECRNSGPVHVAADASD